MAVRFLRHKIKKWPTTIYSVSNIQFLYYLKRAKHIKNKFICKIDGKDVCFDKSGSANAVNFSNYQMPEKVVAIFISDTNKHFINFSPLAWVKSWRRMISKTI